MPALTDWIQAARPKTLGAAVAPVAVGSVLGWKIGGEFSLQLLIATLGSCLCLQIATNFFNDAIDHLKGADTAKRMGPRRITAAGASSAKTTLNAGWIMLMAAAGFALPLILARGPAILLIGIPSLYFAYGYTGGPIPLAYRGLGELFVILFFGLVAVTGSAFVQSGEWFASGLVAGVQIGCLSTVLIAINNLRDVDEDRRSNKRTLAVRFGVGFGRFEITLLIVAAHAMGFYWWESDFESAFTWPLAVSPLGGLIAIWVWRTRPSPVYNRFLALSGLQLLVFTLLLCLGIARSNVVSL
jgi:1,4-dihydroxy-2-naphthoate octaprenyltransferase